MGSPAPASSAPLSVQALDHGARALGFSRLPRLLEPNDRQSSWWAHPAGVLLHAFHPLLVAHGEPNCRVEAMGFHASLDLGTASRHGWSLGCDHTFQPRLDATTTVEALVKLPPQVGAFQAALRELQGLGYLRAFTQQARDAQAGYAGRLGSVLDRRDRDTLPAWREQAARVGVPGLLDALEASRGLGAGHGAMGATGDELAWRAQAALDRIAAWSRASGRRYWEPHHRQRLARWVDQGLNGPSRLALDFTPAALGLTQLHAWTCLAQEALVAQAIGYWLERAPLPVLRRAVAPHRGVPGWGQVLATAVLTQTRQLPGRMGAAPSLLARIEPWLDCLSARLGQRWISCLGENPLAGLMDATAKREGLHPDVPACMAAFVERAGRLGARVPFPQAMDDPASRAWQPLSAASGPGLDWSPLRAVAAHRHLAATLPAPSPRPPTRL